MIEDIPFVRSAGIEDLESFYSFAKEAGHGFIHLVQDKQLLREKLELSEKSFKTKVEKPWHETYFFILQVGQKTIGCSGLISRIGVSEPFFAYHLLPTPQESQLLHIKRDIPTLHFIRARKKPTELCSLFLQASYRGKEFGRLLSFSRFLFIAAFRSHFAPVVVAELRGVSDNNGQSPFWDGLGRHFFGMDFNAANSLRIAHPECIEELFPTHPIYTILLSKEAQAVLSKPHPLTVPAFKLLQAQGFSLSHYMDLFDAGPHVYAQTDSIQAIQHSQTGVVKHIKNLNSSTSSLIANERTDFRACFGMFEIQPEGNVALDTATAKALQVDVGDVVRYTGI